MPIIEVNGLKKTYEAYKKEPGFKGSLKALFKREKIETDAVKGIAFDIEEGELVGFLGPNGAGKTTTLKMLSGILYPTSGEATVLGHVPWKRQRAFQKQFSIVMGQKNQLWWDLPARESFLLNKEIYEVPDDRYEAVVNDLATKLDVLDILDVQVRKLSLGQRMKCELIAALLHEPKVLFLDEPTIGLDVTSQQTIREFIRKVNAEKKTTIILTSHYMDDVEALCERVIVINNGGIVYDGSLQALKDKHVSSKVLKVSFQSPIKREQCADLETSHGITIRKCEATHLELVVPKDQSTEVAREILGRFDVDDILIDEIEIEEVIREVFEETTRG
ncbi:MAG: ABC transporter ATP-binding protein [Candidatus Andersenbacteria bacterium]|nr:ABC transporter ATP-binding protein [Candidatus Andersenbacteria bacterium]